ncbi:MAG: hypothetical protein ABSC30_16285, partial [Acidimicrobiales bacterium]
MVLIIVIAVAASGGNKKNTNNTSGVVTTPTSAPAPPGGGGGAEAPTTSTTAGVAHVGAELPLTDESGNKFTVTAVSVVDPGTGSDTFTTADVGTRFVGVEFKFTNTGSAAISPTPDNEATVIDSTGHGESPDIG